MTYRDTLIRLSEQSESEVVAVYRAYLDGRIDASDCADLIASILGANNSRAAALADLSLTATLETALGVEVPTAGALPRATDTARLLKAARSVGR